MVRFIQQTPLAVTLLLIQIIITLLFFLWPASGAVLQSLFYSDAFGLQKTFAGINNFFDLFINRDYLQAVWVTFIIAIAITLLTLFFGLALALLVHQRKRSQVVYKTLLLWPYAVAPAIAAILWRFLFHPTLGWLTHLLNYVGVDFNYVIHPAQAMMVVIVAASWQQFSYNFLFYFGALKMIPSVLTDAAILDGASSWQRFWKLQLPLLSPTTFFLFTMNILYALFDTFGIIDIITKGGPGHTTTTLIYKVYEDGFIGMDPGSSSAQSVILILLIIGMTLLQFRYLEKKVFYE